MQVKHARSISPDCSLIDLNRSGIALMEIVTEPDLSSPYEAAEYVKNTQSLKVYWVM